MVIAFNINEVSILTGINIPTLRAWEKRYNLIKPQRLDSGIRVYSNEELKILLQASLLTKAGIKISAFASLNSAERKQKIDHLTESHSGLNDDPTVLLDIMFALDETSYHKVISHKLLQSSFEGLIETYFFPILRKIGFMWLAGRIAPVYEHFLTNLIRNSICTATNSLPLSNDSKTKKFLLFLPEGETHELALLYANYLIRKSGQSCLYLGQNVKLDDVIKLSNDYQPDFILSNGVSTNFIGLIQTFFQSSSDYQKVTKWLISGENVNESNAIIMNEKIIKIENWNVFKNILFNAGT